MTSSICTCRHHLNSPSLMTLAVIKLIEQKTWSVGIQPPIWPYQWTRENTSNFWLDWYRVPYVVFRLVFLTVPVCLYLRFLFDIFSFFFQTSYSTRTDFAEGFLFKNDEKSIKCYRLVSCDCCWLIDNVLMIHCHILFVLQSSYYSYICIVLVSHVRPFSIKPLPFTPPPILFSPRYCFCVDIVVFILTFIPWKQFSLIMLYYTQYYNNPHIIMSGWNLCIRIFLRPGLKKNKHETHNHHTNPYFSTDSSHLSL